MLQCHCVTNLLRVIEAGGRGELQSVNKPRQQDSGFVSAGGPTEQPSSISTPKPLIDHIRTRRVKMGCAHFSHISVSSTISTFGPHDFITMSFASHPI